MRWLPTYSMRTPIGLDIGTHSFKAVQLRGVGVDMKVSKVLTLPRATPGIPLEEAEMARLRDVLDRRGFAGRDVIVGIPSDKLLTSILELPPRSPGLPMDAIALAEFSRIHRLESDALTVSTWDLPPNARASKATYIHAVGAESIALETHIDLIESSGLNVRAIDETYSATARGALRDVGDASGLTAVINFGWSATNLAIVKNGLVVYTRRITDGGIKYIEAAAREIAPDEGEIIDNSIWHVGFSGPGSTTSSAAHSPELQDLLSAHFGSLRKEFSQAFSYTGHQYPDAPMNRLLLTGGGAMIPNIEIEIQDLLNIPTSVVKPTNTCDLHREIGSGNAAMITAIGLALSPGESK